MNFSEDILQQVEDYLDGKMDDNAQKLFEKKILEETDLLEFINLNKEMRLAYNEKDWLFIKSSDKKEAIEELTDYFNSEDANATKSAIKNASNEYFNKRKNRYYSFFAIAASIVLLLGYFLMNKSVTNNELFLDYNNWNEIPSLTTRSDIENDLLVNGEEAFLNKNYKEAELSFEQFFKNHETINSTGLIYLGVSQLELDKYDESLLTFDKLINSNAIDKSKGYWYKTLVYLKMNNTEMAIKQLEIISQDSLNYNYKKALEILSKIKNNIGE